MEKKQSSIEWLLNHWKKLQLEGEKMSWNQVIEITELAKAMHKEEIIDAFGVGCHYESKRLVGYQDVAEKYYNETFEGGDK